MRTAAHLRLGEKAIIEDIDNDHPSSRRIMEVGFTPGEEIELAFEPLFKDPIAISIRGTIIAIRKSEAECILLEHDKH
jgi:ferrous iron transport protein A